MIKRIMAIAPFALIAALAACDGPSPTAPINIEFDPDPSVNSTDVVDPGTQHGGVRQ